MSCLTSGGFSSTVGYCDTPFFYCTNGQFSEPNKNDQNILIELFVAGKLVPVIDRRYSLSQVEKAIRYFGEGHAKGKVVICV